MKIRDPSRREALLGLGISAGAALIGAPARSASIRRWPLWTVEAGGSRIFLTGETPPRRVDWSDARIEKALSMSSAMWNETNHIRREDIGALIARHGIDDSATLSARLGEVDKERLAAALKITGLDGKSIGRFRPWLVGQSLDELFYPKLGYTGRSASTILAAQAEAAGKPVFSEFAASDDVVAWFGAMTPEQDVDYLRYTLDHIIAGPAAEDAILADWANGKPGRAAAWIARMKRRYPALDRVIVIDRNRGWVPRIRTMLAQGRPTLVITGLYHLVGPDSVQSQLHAAGLRIRPSSARDFGSA